MKITTAPDVAVPGLRFLPSDFDASDVVQLTAQVDRLLGRPVGDAAQLQDWLQDASEIERAVTATRSRRRIAMTRNTDDESIRESFLAFEREVVPEWDRLNDKLNRRYVTFETRRELPERYGVFDRQIARAVALFREENVALATKETELKSAYQKMTGGRLVEFRGESITMQRCATFLEDPDRLAREAAFDAIVASRMRDQDKTEELFEEMLDVRQRMARNAGFDDYRDYAYQARHREAYGPADCHGFHAAVEAVAVPLRTADAERIRVALGLESMRPYDQMIDPTGGAAMQPFADEASYIELGRRFFTAVDPVFAEEFEILVRNGLLDLMSRPGKAPGGYNAHVPDLRLPFVFINAVGRQGDVRTLLHEGGHAFHTLATRDEPVLGLARAPIEFCEVASMSMELFALEHYEEVFGAEVAKRATDQFLRSRLRLFTWVATIDAFQDWLYTHPGHTREERTAKWRELRRRYAPHLDWTGLDDALDTEWHQQLHIFRFPFYYIEYALALIGSLQLWVAYQRDPQAAVRKYRAALRLGGTKPLPGLFEAAGGRFAMDRPILETVTGAVAERLGL